MSDHFPPLDDPQYLSWRDIFGAWIAVVVIGGFLVVALLTGVWQLVKAIASVFA